MFQDALVESSGSLKAKKSYANGFAALLNAALVIGLVSWPLLRPLTLPRQALTRLLVAPAPPIAPAPHAVAGRKTSEQVEPLLAQMKAPSVIPKAISTLPDAAPSSLEGIFPQNSIAGGVNGILSDVIGGIDHASTPPVVVAPPRKIIISSGVMAGEQDSWRDARVFRHRKGGKSRGHRHAAGHNLEIRSDRKSART